MYEPQSIPPTRDPGQTTARRATWWPVCLALLFVVVLPPFVHASEDIVFASGIAGSVDIWTISPDASQRSNLSAVSHDPEGLFRERTPRWSPDGDRIAFVSRKTGIDKIWIMNADGSGDFMLNPQSSLGEVEPAWSPDGRRIYFAGNAIFPDGQGCASCRHWEIWIKDLDTGAETQLTENSFRDITPVVSPDGQIVVFTKAERANDCCNPTDLWQMGANGESQSLVFPQSTDPFRYEWVFDWGAISGLILGGKQYGSSAANDYEIALFDLDGSVQRLTNNSVYDLGLAFSPGEDKILFSSTRAGDFDLFIGDVSNPDLNPFQLTDVGTIRGADWRSVPSLGCRGFEPPLSGGPVTVRGKNRALPLKATLTDSCANPVTSADLTSPPVAQILSGDPPVDVTDLLTSAGHGARDIEFTFNDEGFWQLNLKTRDLDRPGQYTVALVSGDLGEYRVDPVCWVTLVIE